MGSLVQLQARRRMRRRVYATGGKIELDEEARELLTRGYLDLFSEAPSLPVAQAMQAQSLHESGYGRGWGRGASDAGQGSNNWGAIQGGIQSGTCHPDTPPPVCAPGQGFLHGDTTPLEGGGSRHYQCCYRIYASPLEGATDVVRKMFVDRPSVHEAAKRGDLAGFSAAMYDTGYYEGFGPSREDRIWGHMNIIRDKVARIAESLDEPVALSNEPLEAERRRKAKSAALPLLAVGAGLAALVVGFA